jgi:tryptophan synthase beta subunit
MEPRKEKQRGALVRWLEALLKAATRDVKKGWMKALLKDARKEWLKAWTKDYQRDYY